MAGKETPGGDPSGKEPVAPAVEEQEPAALEAEEEGEEAEEAAPDDEAGDGDTAAAVPDGEGEEGDGESPEQVSKSKARRLAQRQREATLRQTAQEAMARAEAAERTLKALAAEVGPEPKKENYADPDEFIADRAAWKADMAAVARQHKVAQSQAKQAGEDAHQSELRLFHERTRALAERFPDIEAKVLGDSSGLFDERLGQLILDTDEQGPAVAYYLATHREEAQRIQNMPPRKAAVELGKIAARMETAPKPRTVTNAPKPVPKVGGGGGKPPPNPDKMSDAAWTAYRRAEILREARKKRA